MKVSQIYQVTARVFNGMPDQNTVPRQTFMFLNSNRRGTNLHDIKLQPFHRASPAVISSRVDAVYIGIRFFIGSSMDFGADNLLNRFKGCGFWRRKFTNPSRAITRSPFPYRFIFGRV